MITTNRLAKFDIDTRKILTDYDIYSVDQNLEEQHFIPKRIFSINLKLESTQKDRSRYQLWLFFTKISFKQLHEERFEYFQVSNS